MFRNRRVEDLEVQVRELRQIVQELTQVILSFGENNQKFAEAVLTELNKKRSKEGRSSTN